MQSIKKIVSFCNSFRACTKNLCIDNWTLTAVRVLTVGEKSNSPKKLGFFLEKNNPYIIIYSKVSNFKVYKGGFDNVCWKRKRIKTTK